MNIVVCLKQVPETTSVKINPETNTLVREGIENVINPFDAYALEEGVRLRERFGGRVTAVSMGPPQAEPMLREAVSCGADAAVLLSDPAFAGSDTLATSATLAAAVRKLSPCDLVICGRQTVDGDTGQVGPEMAENLCAAFVAYASEIQDVSGGRMRLKRMTEDGYEVVSAPLPAVITVVKEINRPRLPSLRGLIRAKDTAVPVWKAADVGLDAAQTGLNGSATQVAQIFFPERVSKAEMLEGAPEAQAGTLYERLRGAKII